MSSKVMSAAVIGLDAEIIEVEADTGPGELNSMTIVGLPDAAISESRERVRSAIRNSGLDLPKLKITINLAPADLKKHGPSYDLPIAISILLINGCLPSNLDLSDSLIVGELALSGEVRSVNGILPIAFKAKRAGFKRLFVPKVNANEACLVNGLEIYGVENLKSLIDHLTNKNILSPTLFKEFIFANADTLYDLAHVRGQEQAKRALEIAAAGGHNILMSGPPGSGKTLLAKTIPSILPDLNMEEALEITKIYSVAGLLNSNFGLVTSRPFRAPHHTASGVALVGGGSWPKPGEISLAHRGVLFLDEFAEFPRVVLENLRQPLEDGVITVSRAAGNLSFPAKFILVAAMNPCPCGYYGDQERSCICSQSQIINYRKKISGPILDRIDLHVEVPRLEYEKLTQPINLENSQQVKSRVTKARLIQTERFQDLPFFVNAEMTSEVVRQYAVPDREGADLLKVAVSKLKLSVRSYFRILKIARTIADLNGQLNVEVNAIAEALQYRPKIE